MFEMFETGNGVDLKKLTADHSASPHWHGMPQCLYLGDHRRGCYMLVNLLAQGTALVGLPCQAPCGFL